MDEQEHTDNTQTEEPNGKPVRSQGRYVALDATKIADAVVDLGSEPKTLEELTVAVDQYVKSSEQNVSLVTAILKDEFSKTIEVVVNRKSLR